MIWKRKYLIIAAIVVTFALSVSVVYAAWDVDDMVSWAENTARPKIWKLCYLVTNEVNPLVHEIKDLMGNGLVGEWYATYGPYHPTYTLDLVDIGAGETTVFAYYPDHPVKFSMWIEGDYIPSGEWIQYRIYYDADGGGGRELYRSWWVYPDDAELILDQLPISESISITAEPSTAGVCDVEGSVIIEEV